MSAINTTSLIDLALPLLFYFAVGTLGAFVKDLYETMIGKIKKIRLGEVLIGGIVTTIICLGLSDNLFKDFSLNTMLLITFVIGVLGFEIFGNMTSISKIRKLLKIIDEVRKNIPEDSQNKHTNGSSVNKKRDGSPDNDEDSDSPKKDDDEII